jgi:hypothetical protein
MGDSPTGAATGVVAPIGDVSLVACMSAEKYFGQEHFFLIGLALAARESLGFSL